jgi:hypothetical protein
MARGFSNNYTVDLLNIQFQTGSRNNISLYCCFMLTFSQKKVTTKVLNFIVVEAFLATRKGKN